MKCLELTEIGSFQGSNAWHLQMWIFDGDDTGDRGSVATSIVSIVNLEKWSGSRDYGSVYVRHFDELHVHVDYCKMVIALKKEMCRYMR